MQIDRIMSGNREDPPPFGHDDVCALASNSKPGSLESANNLALIDKLEGSE